VTAAYQQDLAYIHDTGYTRFITKAAPGLLHILRWNGVSRGLVVDAGCGSGVWARQLNHAGYEVLGIDISADMIRLARRHAPEAKFRVGSLLTMKLPACAAVTSIGECVNYAFDPRSGRQALFRFFRRVHDALLPGGVLVFDVVEPGVVEDGLPQKRYAEGRDWAILLEVRENRRHILTRRVVSFRQVGKLYRRSEEIHRLHLYENEELLRELIRIGFQVQVKPGYGRFRFAPAHAAFVACKPE
jgi:SAM-dependent methyltransferase